MWELVESNLEVFNVKKLLQILVLGLRVATGQLLGGLGWSCNEVGLVHETESMPGCFECVPSKKKLITDDPLQSDIY